MAVAQPLAISCGADGGQAWAGQSHAGTALVVAVGIGHGGDSVVQQAAFVLRDFLQHQRFDQVDCICNQAPVFVRGAFALGDVGQCQVHARELVPVSAWLHGFVGAGQHYVPWAVVGAGAAVWFTLFHGGFNKKARLCGLQVWWIQAVRPAHR